MDRTRSRTKGPLRRPRQTSRYSARYLLLVYNKPSCRFDPLEIHRLVSQEQAQCTIVRQLHSDGTFNYLAFVDFAGKRFQTRNLALFDIQGHHPKWTQVRSSPWDTLDNVIASGEVVWNGIYRETRKEADDCDAQATIPGSSNSWEYLGSVSDDEDLAEILKGTGTISTPLPATSRYMESRDVAKEPEKVKISCDMKSWRDGYRAGYFDAIAHHNTANRPRLPPG